MRVFGTNIFRTAQYNPDDEEHRTEDKAEHDRQTKPAEGGGFAHHFQWLGDAAHKETPLIRTRLPSLSLLSDIGFSTLSGTISYHDAIVLQVEDSSGGLYAAATLKLDDLKWKIGNDGNATATQHFKGLRLTRAGLRQPEHSADEFGELSGTVVLKNSDIQETHEEAETKWSHKYIRNNRWTVFGVGLMAALSGALCSVPTLNYMRSDVHDQKVLLELVNMFELLAAPAFLLGGFYADIDLGSLKAAKDEQRRFWQRLSEPVGLARTCKRGWELGVLAMLVGLIPHPAALTLALALLTLHRGVVGLSMQMMFINIFGKKRVGIGAGAIRFCFFLAQCATIVLFEAASDVSSASDNHTRYEENTYTFEDTWRTVTCLLGVGAALLGYAIVRGAEEALRIAANCKAAEVHQRLRAAQNAQLEVEHTLQTAFNHLSEQVEHTATGSHPDYTSHLHPHFRKLHEERRAEMGMRRRERSRTSGRSRSMISKLKRQFSRGDDSDAPMPTLRRGASTDDLRSFKVGEQGHSPG